MMSLEDIEKLDLRIGEIVRAERLEGTRRVLKLWVLLGEEQRRVIADLAHFYEPEELIGKQVVVVANLKSGVVHGERSDGKILIVHGEGEVDTFLTTDRATTLGAPVR